MKFGPRPNEIHLNCGDVDYFQMEAKRKGLDPKQHVVDQAWKLVRRRNAIIDSAVRNVLGSGCCLLNANPIHPSVDNHEVSNFTRAVIIVEYRRLMAEAAEEHG